MKQNNLSRLRLLVLCALFAALTAVLAQIILPVGPIPFNLAMLGAFLAGMLLPPVWAAGSMLVYLVMGFIGIPVFAGLAGGPGILFGKTGGYILGYCCIAFCTAISVQHGVLQTKGRRAILFAALGMGVGLVICYALGTAWFMLLTQSNFATALTLCVLPFVVPDIAKGVGAYALGCVLEKRLSRMGFSVRGGKI